MKRTLLAIALFTLFLPIAHRASAADVSIDLFYNNLSGGNWIEAEGYGYGWQPAVASDQNWRPYADGYWAYTDVGWTWVSYEDFGWATYHYGRWARIADYGWVWFPGSDLEWGPAWVSWRVGGGYCGWAPLPPRGPGVVYAGQAIGVGVDLEFDIGPAYYNFVDVRYIGEPVLRDRIFAPTQNVTYISQTVNVTNITYNNNTVYNYGPDYNALSAQSSRPIQRLKLERQQNVDPATAIKSGAITKVQGDKLVVAAPPKIQKPAKLPPPPTVKAKVPQTKIDKGWSGVANAEELKQKIKTEDHKKIPPPPGAAATGGASPAAPDSPMASPAGRAAVSPAATAAAAATAPPAGSPFERGKRRGKPGQPAQPAGTAAPAVSPVQGMAPPAGSPAGKHKGRAGERPGEQLGATPPVGGPAGSPAEAPSPRGKARGLERGMPAQPSTSPAGAPNQPPPGGKHRGPPATTPTPYSGGGPGAGAERANTVKSSKSNTSDRMAGPGGGPPRGGQLPQGEDVGHRPPGAAAPTGAAAEEHGRGKPEGGKKKGGPSPTPSP
jgi:hypothetical protein